MRCARVVNKRDFTSRFRVQSFYFNNHPISFYGQSDILCYLKGKQNQCVFSISVQFFNLNSQQEYFYSPLLWSKHVKCFQRIFTLYTFKVFKLKNAFYQGKVSWTNNLCVNMKFFGQYFSYIWTKQHIAIFFEIIVKLFTYPSQKKN